MDKKPSCLSNAATAEGAGPDFEKPKHLAYPRPSIPLAPVLSARSFSLRQPASALPGIAAAKYIVQVTSGRAAIALALEHSGVGHGAEVLIPAYHCDSMVSPARYVGATPVFFRIDQRARVDFADLAAKVNERSKVLIITHYFGFPQDVEQAREFADRYGLILIEDCAHAFYGRAAGKPIGATGDYAVASAMKFFPILDGGLLASATRDLGNIELTGHTTGFELKNLWTTLEKAFEYKRLPLLAVAIAPLMWLKERAWSIAKRRMPKVAASATVPGSSEGGYELDPAWIHVSMSRVSKAILKLSDKDRIVQGRRANYLKLLEAFQGVPGIRPLLPALDADVVPLVFPAYVDQAATLFPLLKRAGIPIWRFGEYLDREVTKDTCPNSWELSEHVFQFPCHPELHDEEIDWMIRTIREIVGGSQS